jgi:tetratricopeptide (TPR) repeat protein
MAEGAAGDLRPGTLAGYAAFFALRQRHPAGIPVYRKLLGSASVQGNGRRDTLLALARATAAPEPERAAEAYAELFRDRADPEDWDTVAREFFDLLLYRIGNVNRARTVLGHVDRTRKEGDPLRLNMALDLALVQGDTETARDLIQRLQTQRSFGRDQPSHVVRANALGVQVSNLQEQGFPQDAYAALLDWMALPTEDRASGRFTLGRARLWRSWGWTEGAIRDLDSVMALDPILPFLADVQLEKALALQDLGRDRESRSLMLLITREYPNHPAAAAARENLGLPPAREPIP